MNVFMKFAIDSSISNYVFVVYRNGIASVVLAPVALYVDRNVRPAMTFRRFGTILFLSFLGRHSPIAGRRSPSIRWLGFELCFPHNLFSVLNFLVFSFLL
ncbi:hypothetical protein P8452_08087 [Trifolium repens]|nr:hypothetical protein P8452_08087 [Trifolium repens]